MKHWESFYLTKFDTHHFFAKPQNFKSFSVIIHRAMLKLYNGQIFINKNSFKVMKQ